jgi:hypothetical protein
LRFRRSHGAVRRGAIPVDRGADDGLDVFGVETERLTDVNRPDLRSKVVLEVEVAADVGANRLAVLTHHDERRKEDRFETHHHREQSVGELVEDDARRRGPR